MIYYEEILNIPYGKIYTIILGIFTPVILSCNKYLATILIVFAFFLVSGNRPYWIYITTKTCKRDITMLKRLIVAAFTLWRCRVTDMTLPKLYKRLVEKHPEKIVFHTEKRSWTYRELSDVSNCGAHMLKASGLQRGQVVALIMGKDGGAEYPALWLSVATLGATAALIPPQLKSTALLHAITIAKPTMLLYSDDLAQAIEEIIDDPEIKKLKLFQYNLVSEDTPLLKNSISVTSQLKKMPITFLNDELAKGKCLDPFIYIYTSGTTGLPKAAVIKHYRYLNIAVAANRFTKLNDDDVVYTPLPLHHTAGAMIGAGQALLFGLTVVLRGKFSATNFWTDCIKYKCTVAQYIGELCRFLLLRAEKSGDIDPCGPHQIRLMIGNGIRSNLWETFQKTFRIPQICEVYGSTEGCVSLLNIGGKIGSIGFLPRFLSPISPYAILKCDDSGEPIRDEFGFCTRCRPCEPGLIVGRLNAKKPLESFSGYVDRQATKNKVIQNVFSKGDAYFNSGDIVTMDHYGFFYFNDRTGDTFRWRSENVSSTEVENVINSIIGVSNNTVVYGVEVPNTEGKAGMAAIVADNLDFTEFKEKLNMSLPSYAIPVFIRIIPKLEITITFKIIKRHMQAEGFNVNKINDPVYFLDSVTQKYIPMTTEIYNDILNGKVRM